MAHAIGLGLALIAYWLLLSGFFVVLLLSLGVASVLFVVYISHRMDVVDEESLPLGLKLRFLSYWGWLGKEIIKANIDVAKLVLAPRLNLSPRMIKTTATQKTDLGRVVFANSITLTPGTVSIRVLDDHVLVHAITNDMADGLDEGEMDRRVTELEAN